MLWNVCTFFPNTSHVKKCLFVRASFSFPSETQTMAKEKAERAVTSFHTVTHNKSHPEQSLSLWPDVSLCGLSSRCCLPLPLTPHQNTHCATPQPHTHPVWYSKDTLFGNNLHHLESSWFELHCIDPWWKTTYLSCTFWYCGSIRWVSFPVEIPILILLGVSLHPSSVLTRLWTLVTCWAFPKASQISVSVCCTLVMNYAGKQWNESLWVTDRP